MISMCSRALALAAMLAMPAGARGQDADPVARLLEGLASSDHRAQQEAYDQASKDVQLALRALPQLLARLDMLAEPAMALRLVHGLGTAHRQDVSTAVREVVQRKPGARLLALAARYAHDILCEPKLLEWISVAPPPLAHELGGELANTARSDASAVPVFLAVLEVLPHVARQNMLHAAAQAPGPWRRALWPALQRHLRTMLANPVLQLLAPEAGALPSLVDAIREVLQQGSAEQAGSLAWLLGQHPTLGRSLLPELVAMASAKDRYGKAASMFSKTYPVQMALAALGRIDASDGTRAVVVARLGDPAKDVVAAALEACARLHLTGEDVAAALRAIAETGTDSRTRTAAAVLSWALDPERWPAPEPRWLGAPGSHQDFLQAVTVMALAHGSAPPPAACESPLRKLAGQPGDQGVQLAALLALRRLARLQDSDLQSLVSQLGHHSSDPSRLVNLRATLAGLGEGAMVAVGRQQATRPDPETLAWLTSLGESALPARIAAAGVIAKLNPTVRALFAKELTAGGNLPADWRRSLTKPTAFLRELADPAQPPRCRALALRELLTSMETAAGDRVQAAADLLVLGDEDARKEAVAALRREGREALPQLHSLWLTAPLAVRRVAGVLLRELDPTLPKMMPPWLLRDCLDAFPELRHQAALRLLAAGEPEPAVDLLRKLPAGSAEAASLLATLAEHGVDLGPDAEILLGHFTQGGPAVTGAFVLAAHCRQCPDDVAAKLIAHAPYRQWLLQKPDPAAASRHRLLQLLKSVNPESAGTTRGYLLPESPGFVQEGQLRALLALFPRLSERERRDVLHWLGTPAAQWPRSMPAIAAFLPVAWQEAASWSERSQLVDLAARFGVPLPVTGDEVARMVADARAEVRNAGLVAGSLLQDASVLHAVQDRFAGETPAERGRLLHHLARAGELPDWVRAADLAALADAMPLADLLAVLARWRAGPADDAQRLLVRHVLRVLSSARTIDRELAAAALARMPATWEVLGSRDSVGTLASEPELLHALGARASHEIVRLLRDASPELQPFFAAALAGADDQALTDVLAPLLASPEPLRSAAVRGLRGAGYRRLAALLTLPPEELADPSVLQALASWGKDAATAVPRLLALHATKEYPALDQALPDLLAGMGSTGLVSLEQLARQGCDVVPTLLRLLQSDDDDTVVAALRTFIAVQPKQGAELLLQWDVRARGERVQRWYGVALAQFGHRLAAPRSDVLDGLMADDPALRAATLPALARLDPPPPALAALCVEALWDPAFDVRRAAAQVMAEGGILKRAATAVRERLAVETDAEVRALLAR